MGLPVTVGQVFQPVHAFVFDGKADRLENLSYVDFAAYNDVDPSARSRYTFDKCLY